MKIKQIKKGSLFERHSQAIVPILIAITALLIYSNTFSFPFHFDDTSSITENDKIRVLSNFLDTSGTRYIGELSFALNYYFGEFNVFGYHLVNIIIHIINGILIWWLVNLTFKTPVMQRQPVNLQVSSLIALAASLIFITHPIQTQAVTYIVQRFASLATLFYLLSLVLFVRWRLSSGSGYRAALYLFSLLSVVLSMKTKEMSFTLPFIILLYEFFFFRARLRKVYFLIPYLLTLLIIPLSIIGIGSHKPVGDIVGGLGEAARETELISRGSYLLTQFRVIVTYIRLLFLPVNQNLDYDYPVYHAFFIPGVFLSFLFLLFLIGLGVYLLIRSQRNGNGYAPLISFGIFWFFITLSVESSIIPIRDVIFEHRLYLPAVGAVIAFSSAMLYGFEHWRGWIGIGKGERVSSFPAAVVLLLIIIVLLSFATYQRNLVWRDGITLWSDVVSKSPLKARVHYNLGINYYDSGILHKAIEEYKTTIRLKHNYAEIHNNLGVIYARQGRMDEAIAEFGIALRLESDLAKAPVSAHAYAHYNLALIYVRQERVNEAIEEFRTAARLEPGFVDAHYNLGLAYEKLGFMDDAEEEYIITVKLKPGFSEAHNSLGNSYARQGRIDKAIEEYMIALKLKPGYAKAHNNLGLAYAKQGRLDDAIEEFDIALRLDPDYSNASYNIKLAYQKKESGKRGDR